MRVTICSSSSENIDKKYLDSSITIIDFFAKEGFDLYWGSGSKSLMGLCYDIFVKYNRKIYGYTTSKYLDEINNLSLASHNVFNTTFDLKKNMFNDADIVLFLPGGLGTVSEFFAYLEEVRSNDIKKPIILYNGHGCYDSIIILLQELINNSFNTDSVNDLFYVVNSLDELLIVYKSVLIKE